MTRPAHVTRRRPKPQPVAVDRRDLGMLCHYAEAALAGELAAPEARRWTAADRAPLERRLAKVRALREAARTARAVPRSSPGAPAVREDTGGAPGNPWLDDGTADAGDTGC